MAMNRIIKKYGLIVFIWLLYQETDYLKEVQLLSEVYDKCSDRSLCYRTEVTIMDKRTEYVEKLSAQMVEWDNQIELLKDKAERTAPESKSDYSKAIVALQLKRDEAALRLQGISAASDDEWEDLKTGTENAWGEVRTILHDAIMKIK